MIRRCALVLGLLVLGLPTPAQAQITFTYDSSANPGYYTQDRLDAIARAGTYLGTQFDARGTVNVVLGTQSFGSNPLAVGGTNYFFQNGGFSNGITFQQATTGDAGVGPNAQSFIDFNSDMTAWHTGAGSSAGTGLTDLQSVALHELTHGLGFASLINVNVQNVPNGSGLQRSSPGQPDTYSRLDNFLRLGTAPDAPRLINPNGTFNTAQITSADLTSSNIYFHGEFAMAANGGQPVRLAGGNFGDFSHLDSSLVNSVMLPGIGINTDRRTYQPAELGMLIDIGWNQFAWKDTSGSWGNNTTSTASTPWQNLDGADILSPVGTITTNMVLRFGGSGGYTSTNNLDLSATGGRFLLTRLILNATGGTSTIAASGGNTLRFGTTIGVVPQIRQEGAGAFLISHAVELTNSGLQLAGDGTGRVTLSGAISQQSGQTGTLTKIGTGTFVLSGNNTYTGGTTVSAGTLLVNGQTAGNSGTGTGAVIVNGGTLGGTGRVGATVTVTSGTLAPGDGGAGTFTINSDLAFGSTGTRSLTVDLNGPTAGTLYDQLVVNGTVSLNGATLNAIRGYTPQAGDQLFIIVNKGPNAVSGTFNGLDQGASFDLNGVTAFISYEGDIDLGTLQGGNDVVISFSPVPEPLSVFGFSVAGLALGAFVRRPARR